MMQGFKKPFSKLYAEFAMTPELAKFPRFLAEWSWILNNEVAIIEKKSKECNDTIADIHGFDRERNVVHVTDYHCVYDVEEDPVLKAHIEDLRSLIRRYSKDFILAHSVANLPEQDPIFARYFSKHPDVFADGVYGPTNEDADKYRQVPPHPDLGALKGRQEEDTITNFLLKHIVWINEWIHVMISWTPKRSSREDAHESSLPDYIEIGTVRTAMDFFAGLIGVLLLVSTLGILNSIETDAQRIIALGCLALVLLWSLLLLVPSRKRNDSFAIAVAYFAVGGIFIGSRSRGSY